LKRTKFIDVLATLKKAAKGRKNETHKLPEGAGIDRTNPQNNRGGNANTKPVPVQKYLVNETK
jgi:hypothetical protein